MHRLSIAAVLAAVLLWGGSFSAMKTALETIGPLALVWLRMAVATAIILPVTYRKLFRGYQKGDWKPLLLLVLFQPCLYFLLESHALELTTSSQAGVISASVPLLVAVGAGLALGERITLKTLAGLTVALLGVSCLTLSGRAETSAPNPLLGNILEFCAMASAAAYMLLLKKLSSRYCPWSLTALQSLAGMIFFLPGAFSLSPATLMSMPAKEILIILYLGAFVTLGAFGLYNLGISRIPASSASAFINLVPVVAIFFGWLALGETLTPVQTVAALAVFLGVGISQRAQAEVQAET